MMGQAQPQGISRRAEIFLLLFPAIIWLALFKDFLTGQIVVNVDTNANYAIYKYLFNNLFNGVVPLWNPFINSGVPNVLIASVGLLNPLVAALSLLHFFGLNYYQIFTLYLVAYYFIGALGFYLLAKQILSDKLDALLAYGLLLFSGMGPMLFTQIYLLQIFVPAVWFFYFLISFSQRFYKTDMAGMAFVGTVMCYSYLPPYFITLFWIFILLWAGLFPGRLKLFFRRSCEFFREKKDCVFICLFFLMLAVGSFGISQQAHGTDDLFLLGRHDWRNYATENLQSAKMSFLETGFSGTLGERLSGGRIFSNLDKYPYTEDSFLYLPILVYLMIALSGFVDFDRKRFLLLFLGTGIFLLALGGTYPAYRFVFLKIPYFQYFRNLFLFSAFLIPLAILFAVAQWQMMRGTLVKIRQRRTFWFVVASLLHLCFFLWMRSQGNILTSSYLTVALSWVIAVLLISGSLYRSQVTFAVILLALCALEPMDVFGHFRSQARQSSCRLPAEHIFPDFSYTRGVAFNVQLCPMYEPRSYHEYWYGMVMKDSPGIPREDPLVVSRWVFTLWRNVEQEDFLNCLKYKFWVYDDIRPFRNTSQDLADFNQAFKGQKNAAFVFGDTASGMDQPSTRLPREQALKITGDSEKFKVLRFNANQVSLLTNFDQEKFLVYTDAYHPNWKVLVNGKLQQLYRANVAFKGVWLPAGRNQILFQYSPQGGWYLYALGFFSQCGILFYLIILSVQRRRGGGHG